MQDLIPVTPSSLVTICVEGHRVESLLHLSQFDFVEQRVGSRQVFVMLSRPPQKFQVLVKGSSKVAFAVSQYDDRKIMLLVVLHIADVLPPAQGNRLLAVHELTHGFVNNDSFGGPVKLLFAAQIALVLHGMLGRLVHCLVKFLV